MHNYVVYGWMNGSDYEEGKPADHSIKIRARNEGQAEDIGEKQMALGIGFAEEE
jgi:hypothetical protein